MPIQTVGSHTEARASGEADLLSARRTAPSGPSHVALRAHFRSDRSCLLFSRVATTPRSEDAMTATLLCHEDSCIRMREPSRPWISTSWTRISHPRGLTSSLWMLSWQGSTQGCPGGQPTLAATAPNDREVPSLACGPGTTTSPPCACDRGLATPRATSVRSLTASGTSVSYVNSNPSLST